jgi:hypothetical protein
MELIDIARSGPRWIPFPGHEKTSQTDHPAIMWHGIMAANSAPGNVL